MEATLNALLESVWHPYARYGLAVALRREEFTESRDESGLRKALIAAIETGLENFRMQTADVPESAELLRFQPIPLSRLEQDATLVQSSGLAQKGYYLYPTIVTTDGGAKLTFAVALSLLKEIKSGTTLWKRTSLQRSFAPMVAKINSGKVSQTEPDGTLLEAACALITTLTPEKPAVLADLKNTAILPDIPLDSIKVFITVFRSMTSGQAAAFLQTKPLRDEKKGTASYRRPPLHNGNYPDAPRNSEAFGAVGLLAAIGKWASTTTEEQRRRALLVLDELTERPIYLVSYDAIVQTQFSHHVVGLAKNGILRDIVDHLYRWVILYPDAEKGRPNWEGTDYRLFYMMASRFLQFFSTPYLRDFMAFRAEYPASLHYLFKEYFMEKEGIDPKIVHSARVLGQWINRSAFQVTLADYDGAKWETLTEKQKGAIRRDKVKILAEFEGAIHSAKDAADLLHRVSVRSGRLLGFDAPADSSTYYDAVLTGEGLSFEQAKHLLIAYMRLQHPFSKRDEGSKDSGAAVDVQQGNDSSNSETTE